MQIRIEIFVLSTMYVVIILRVELNKQSLQLTLGREPATSEDWDLEDNCIQEIRALNLHSTH